MTSLVFAEPAAHDLECILDYIALDNPSAAETAYRAIVAAARRLIEFPDMGRAGLLPGTRELSVPSLRYVIIYTAEPKTVTILAIFHGARDLVRALAERRAELKL